MKTLRVVYGIEGITKQFYSLEEAEDYATNTIGEGLNKQELYELLERCITEECIEDDTEEDL